jgi:hypothetical protein
VETRRARLGLAPGRLFASAILLISTWLMMSGELQGDLAFEHFIDAFAIEGMPIGDVLALTSEDGP